MLTSIEGVYENGVVRLLEPLPGVDRARVVVTVLPDTPAPWPQRETAAAPESPEEAVVETAGRPLTGDAVVDHYQPRIELGRKLVELRRAYIESGGKSMTQDEGLAEVRHRRGEGDDEMYSALRSELSPVSPWK